MTSAPASAPFALPTDFRMPACAFHDAAVILDGEYDIPLATPPATVLDVGANVGIFTLWAAQRWPHCHIAAYEPLPENFRDLDGNTQHIAHRVGLSTLALSDRTARDVKMFRGRNRMCGSVEAEGSEGETVSVHLLDAAALESKEFVKLDVEGHELAILQRLNLNNTRAIALEAHSHELAVACITELEHRGFQLHEQRPTVNGCYLLKFIRHGEALTPAPAPTEHREPSTANRAKKVFVALPVYGGFHPFFVGPLMQLQMEPPCSITIRQCPGDSLVARARNKLAAEFLQSDCTHLLFLDTDLIFTPEQIARLVSHDEPIVGGLYPKKQPKLEWVINMLDGTATEPDARGLQRVKYLGTGCLLIAREVFTRMIEAHPEIAYTPDRQPGRTEWDFFSCGVFAFADGSRRYLSEDWYFCQRALDLGYPVHADVHVVLKHVGDCVYPLEDPFTPVDAPALDTAH